MAGLNPRPSESAFQLRLNRSKAAALQPRCYRSLRTSKPPHSKTIAMRRQRQVARLTFCFQDIGGWPVWISSIVMQPCTGQTSAHRLQPTHSSSMIRGT
jgi:hypothetical protein